MGRRDKKRKKKPVRKRGNEVERFIHQFKVAAAEGALIELKLRILAEKNPETEAFAYAHKLEDVEVEIAKWFGDRMADTSKELLKRCRQLRNKLLHADFRVARQRLEELGVAVKRGGVRKIDLTRAVGGAEILKRLVAASEGKPQSYTEVADSKTTAEVSIFGWLLEMGKSGALHDAAHVFRKAGDLVDQLIAQVDQIALEKRRGD